MKWIATLSTLGLLGAVAAGRRTTTAWPPVVVHEWGTITTHHAPDGTPRGRLNHVTGPDTLPAFVYRYDPPPTSKDPERSLVKTALVAGRPDVTMRLETPVMYFYPPHGVNVPPFNVDVHFRGGIVNEFYPKGDASVEMDVERLSPKTHVSAVPARWDGQLLDNSIVGRLRWSGLTLRDNAAVPATTSHVWLAPRHVHATGVIASSGESERYLFYRGVAHLDAVVQTQLTAAEVRLRAPKELQWMDEPTTEIPDLWLVDVRADGLSAFRERGALTIARGDASAELGRLELFSNRDYAAGKLTELRSSMKHALVAAGLYDDEAEAMLETWGASYFHQPGLRIFYIVPRAWVNYYLPVEISVPHQMTRVLVGRIDLERDKP
jgi:hypothetical protein